MTEPGDAAVLLHDLPADVGRPCELTQGVLIHSDWLGAYGMSAPHPGPISRDTLPLSLRPKLIAGPLAAKRSADEQSIGTCRDYAVTMP